MTRMKKIFKSFLDRRLILLIVYFYTSYTLVSILRFWYLKSNGLVRSKVSWSTVIQGYMADYIIVILLMPLLAYLIKSMIVRKIKLKYAVLVHLVFSLSFGILISFGLNLLQSMFGLDLNVEFCIKGIFEDHMRSIHITFPIYFGLSGIIYVYYYINQVKEAKILEGVMHNQLNESKIKVLQSQLQPHFFFNTLNTIFGLIGIDNTKAKDTVADLSQLMRRFLFVKESNLVSLKEELEFLRKYVDIIKVRFSDHIEFVERVDQKLKSALVPTLILQPLVENSVKHGYWKKNLNLNIFIDISASENDLTILIENDGAKLTGDFVELIKRGVGLKNIDERLNAIYKGNYQFEVINKKGGGVANRIVIPLEFSE